MGRREASREICEHGSYFRLKDENPASRAVSLNLPGESALGEDGTSGHTFPDLFPPLADTPSCYILSEDLDPSRKNGRSHTSFASYWREGRGTPPSTFLRREIETYMYSKCKQQQHLKNPTWKMKVLNTYNVILPCGT